MTRILSLDWGTKRIGAAISDELNIIATAFSEPLEPADVFNQLQKIIIDNQISKIVVGLPINLKSQENKTTQAVREFIGELKRRFNVEIFEADERYSSVEAMQRLKSQNKNSKKSRLDKDCLSAQIILENYLSKQKSK